MIFSIFNKNYIMSSFDENGFINKFKLDYYKDTHFNFDISFQEYFAFLLKIIQMKIIELYLDIYIINIGLNGVKQN